MHSYLNVFLSPFCLISRAHFWLILICLEKCLIRAREVRMRTLKPSIKKQSKIRMMWGKGRQSKIHQIQSWNRSSKDALAVVSA